jgi:hypothetical protein
VRRGTIGVDLTSAAVPGQGGGEAKDDKGSGTGQPVKEPLKPFPLGRRQAEADQRMILLEQKVFEISQKQDAQIGEVQKVVGEAAVQQSQRMSTMELVIGKLADGVGEQKSFMGTLQEALARLAAAQAETHAQVSSMATSVDSLRKEVVKAVHQAPTGDLQGPPGSKARTSA